MAAFIDPGSPLTTDFSAGLDARLRWTVAHPPAATPSPTGLTVVPFVSDLWAKTATGHVAHDGAALVAELREARWVAATRLTLHARRPWDQAGLYVAPATPPSIPPSWWMKLCVEAVPGDCAAAAGGTGAVLAASITRGGWTDQATLPLPASLRRADGSFRVALAIVREGDSCAFFWRAADGDAAWTRLRMAPFDPSGDAAPAVVAGIYALAPTAAGCRAVFDRLDIKALAGDPDGGRLLNVATEF